MCGIVGIVSKNECTQDILSGLYSLEYRGYDSSGIATINNNIFEFNKSIGKIVHFVYYQFQCQSVFFCYRFLLINNA